MRFFLGCILVFSGLSFFAQNSDCDTAIPVCNETYVEDNSPTGTGQVFELAPGSCQTSGEFNSAWYVFTVQEAGVLNFILEPNDNDDDYDWSLYDITENGCAGINNGNSPEVSCNSYGLFGGVQGPTGISTAEGGSGNSNGPGDLNGPPFNSDLNVQVGDVYVLSVMNYSSTLNGYTLDFSPSTAAIYDDDNPEVVSVTQNCEADELTITFSENVITTDLNLDLFALNLNGTILTPAQATAGGGDFSSEVTLIFTNPLVGGDYILQGGDDGSVEDFCGNPWVINEPITISPPFVFGTPVINEACNGTAGAISFPDATGGQQPFDYSANGAVANDLNFDNITNGNWVIEVTDAADCVYETTVALPNVIVTVDAGEPQSLCELETSLNATFSADNFQWQPETGITYWGSQNPSSVIEAEVSGNYTLQAIATTDDCEATDFVEIMLVTPPNIAVTHTDETCYGYCDGTISIDNGNPGTITALLDGVYITNNDIQFANVCAGDKEFLVIFSDDCQSTYNVTIDAPARVVASFEADPWTTTVIDTEILFTNTSENADSVYWQLSGYPDINSNEESWSVVLPELLGSYQMTITAFDENGCNDSFIGYILIEDEFRFFIPNTFTPDADNINDVFLPQFSYPPNDYELMIFDRWGEVIFRTTDYWQPWTGEVHNGEFFAAKGIYNWVMKTRGVEVEVQTYQGHVNLIR
ncbi:MAG: gliding motility-associated C-terminal domain-containing protein [Flavobacteriales bacterium]